MSAVSPASTAAEREARVHLQTYAREPITLVAGHGCWVTDDGGRRVCTSRITCLLRDAAPGA